MKLYRHGNTYIAPKGAYFEGNLRIPGNLILPPDTHIWGKLEVDGDLELGQRSSVGGDVNCDNAVIGNDAKVKGALTAIENVVVCDRVSLGSITSGGNITLRPGIVVGEVRGAETIFVYGKIKSEKLQGRQVKVLGTD